MKLFVNSDACVNKYSTITIFNGNIHMFLLHKLVEEILVIVSPAKHSGT